MTPICAYYYHLFDGLFSLLAYGSVFFCGGKTGAEHLFQKQSEKNLIEIGKELLRNHVNIAAR